MASLVIVESPAKAKTIAKYLGSGFTVRSSVGHIRDLPGAAGEAETSESSEAKPKAAAKKKAGAETPAAKAAKVQAALVRRMGVDPEAGWAARYEIIPGKEKVLAELRKLAEKAETIYLATDLDREGEAIAWHLREAIGGDPARYRRVTFSEITKAAIREAFQQPRDLAMDRVNAQQARRFLDRVVGFMVSPLLWKRVARGLSAGRVQSVATRLVVEREREIRAFTPEEYWELHADLHAGADFRAVVAQRDGVKFAPTRQAEIDAALSELTGAACAVAERTDKPRSAKPNPPFTTSTLQQAASIRLGFGVKKTMTLAQRLYEAGHITYMRTDSVNLSADAVSGCRAFIEQAYGARYLPEAPNRYGSREGAQEAHEAIRPTEVRQQPGEIEGLEADQARLYDLIWRQFVACQMPPAEFDTTQVAIRVTPAKPGLPPWTLRANGRVMRFDGWQRVLPVAKRGGDEGELPALQPGQAVDLKALLPSQHFTKPPGRFTEASLVSELEKRGIGRPSTYAAIISTIQDRGYVRLQDRRLFAEKMGEIVTDRLVESFQDLLNYQFTANLEQQLDAVANGEKDWKQALDAFYASFKATLAAADTGMRSNDPVATDIACKTCGRTMQIRTARTGVFLGCSGYSLPPKERCTTTMNLQPGSEAVKVIDAGEEGAEESAELRGKRRCELCGAAMDPWLLDETRRLHICGNNPDCAGFQVETGTFKIKGYDGPTLDCDKCGSPMQLKTGRFGKFFGCTNTACKNTRKLLRNGQAAPPKIDPVKMPELRCSKADDYFVLRDGAAGLFLSASRYPKVRETRNPTVAELQAHAEALPEKYRHIIAAPLSDPEGNPCIVRFSRKGQEHYVAADKDGKPSGFAAFWREGKWVVGKA